jgi:diguanylate cyclase (GGDEF)-like protein
MDLVSLRVNIDKLDRQHLLFQKTLACYQEAIGGIEKHVLAPFVGPQTGHQVTLEPVSTRLRSEVDEPALETSRGAVELALSEAAGLIHQQLAGAVDLKEVLKLLAQTSESLQHRHNQSENRFLDVASDLKSAAEQEDAQELRQRIHQQVTQITHLVEELKAENRLIIEELETEMVLYRRKLDEAEEMANRDTLTGLANRRVLQVRVDEHIESGLPFSLLLIDLNRFKYINDQYGHLAGDELLKLFATRLKRQLRGEDTAARWGGDEFVVLLNCSLSDAMARSRLLEQNLRGEYALRKGSNSLRVQVGLTIGVAEHRATETADQLLARADQILYERKASR